MKKFWFFAFLITILLAFIIRCNYKQDIPVNRAEQEQVTKKESSVTEGTSNSGVIAIQPVVYYDIDKIEGSFNATDDDLGVCWQKQGAIRSEVGVAMDIAKWDSIYPDLHVMSTASDLDGDGKDEQIAIKSDLDTGRLYVYLNMDGKIISLFDLVSKEFYDAVKEMLGAGDGQYSGIELDVACIDLDGESCKEILLAYGNDNGSLVVSLLKYTGGDYLYTEVGGIKGTSDLRYIIITTRNTIFAELFFTHPPTFDAPPMNYVEFAYMEGTLELIRFRDE